MERVATVVTGRKRSTQRRLRAGRGSGGGGRRDDGRGGGASAGDGTEVGSVLATLMAPRRGAEPELAERKALSRWSTSTCPR